MRRMFNDEVGRYLDENMIRLVIRLHDFCRQLFFFNDTATTEIYTLSLHDALPICADVIRGAWNLCAVEGHSEGLPTPAREIDADRKSTRLNSSHSQISYAVFCLKKKKSFGR